MKMLKIASTIVLSILFMTTTAQTTDNIMRVRGEATVKAVPEVLNVYIPLESKAQTYEETTNILTSTFNSLHAELRKAGIEEKNIYSDQLSIAENYNYIDRERVLIGYIGNIAMRIQIPHTEKNLNRVMKVFNNEKYNFGYRISFSFSEAQKDSLREAAIKLAVKDAQIKAAALSAALQVKLGEVKEVNFEFDGGGNDIILRKAMYVAEDMVSAGSDIKLNPQEQEVNKSVGIVWKIEN